MKDSHPKAILKLPPQNSLDYMVSYEPQLFHLMYIVYNIPSRKKMGLRGHFYPERSPNRPFVTNYVLSIVDWVFVLKVFVTKSRNKHSMVRFIYILDSSNSSSITF